MSKKIRQLKRKLRELDSKEELTEEEIMEHKRCTFEIAELEEQEEYKLQSRDGWERK